MRELVRLLCGKYRDKNPYYIFQNTRQNTSLFLIWYTLPIQLDLMGAVHHAS